MKITLRKTDRLFTRLVRLFYDNTCQCCGKHYIEGIHSFGNLGVSHYWGRSRESTRFDLENVTLLCNFPCHRKWEGEDRAQYTEYMLKRLGQEKYDLLELRANTYKKRDDFMDALAIKAQLEEQDETPV